MLAAKERAILWSLKNYAEETECITDLYREGDIDTPCRDNLQEKVDEAYIQAIKLIFSNTGLFEFSNIMRVEYFNYLVENGNIHPLDGTAIYTNFNGKELDYVNWLNLDNYSVETSFVALFYNMDISIEDNNRIGGD